MKRRTGPKPFTPDQIKVAFWSKVTRGKTRECWMWNAAIFKKSGYGKFAVRRRAISAHRYAYFLCSGKMPSSSVDVCHSCDTRSCVNPRHLFLGSRKANMEDCKNKGRNAKGERQGSAVLTAEKVQQMRAAYSNGEGSMTAMGARFGCSLTAAFNAIHKKTWQHV